ncbi:glycosyltransferase family 2 protein [Campylobacter taeniopygiae]|uniref:Glycosyltransferase family 2 protein n=1 Tax=Campylobacter taeniopygiae TaxID=2510188 RepID=A0ABY2TNF9_9BACT|nr:glycosyltransferase family 2 protein [Campylobacter taeniopygiae]TKX34239.1 glycosyltransferase family 2 protein [Campylobacter taeniopygiae]
MPKISIILPTYNVEPYIERALQSCINQTFKDIEIIVVDDCGNDKSIDIAKEYAKKDERIKIVHNEKNLGLLRARYEGVKASNSSYIMFLDPDDYLELNLCEKIVEILCENDMVCYSLFKQDKEMQFVKNDEEISQKLNLDDYLSHCANSKKCYWNLCGKVIKKEKYLQAYQHAKHFGKINMGEDLLIFLYLLSFIKTIYFLYSQNYGYYYCFNIFSLTLSYDNRKYNEQIKILNFIKENFLTLKKGLVDKFYFIIFLDLCLYKEENLYSFYKQNISNTFLLYVKKKMFKIKRRLITLTKKILIKLYF